MTIRSLPVIIEEQHAPLAQWTERSASTRFVVGSNPTGCALFCHSGSLVVLTLGDKKPAGTPDYSVLLIESELEEVLVTPLKQQ